MQQPAQEQLSNNKSSNDDNKYQGSINNNSNTRETNTTTITNHQWRHRKETTIKNTEPNKTKQLPNKQKGMAQVMNNRRTQRNMFKTWGLNPKQNRRPNNERKKNWIAGKSIFETMLNKKPKTQTKNQPNFNQKKWSNMRKGNFRARWCPMYVLIHILFLREERDSERAERAERRAYIYRYR